MKEEDEFGSVSLNASANVKSTLNSLKEHFELKIHNKYFTHPLRYIIERFRTFFYK